MRTLTLLALLAACNASGPSGPTPTTDGAAEVAADVAVDGQPDDVLYALRGEARWADSCSGSAASCPGAMHNVSGPPGAMIDVACEYSTAPGGHFVAFRIAALGPMQQNFDESTAGLRVRGFLPTNIPQLLPAPSGGGLSVRGLGWSVLMAAVGPMTTCHVFVDRVERGGFAGRVDCQDVPDDLTPPRARILRGTFAFAGCSR